jgi:hypothetical protein
MDIFTDIRQSQSDILTQQDKETIDFYVKNGYDINTDLRNSTYICDSEYFSAIKTLDDIFLKTPKIGFENDFVLYRGLPSPMKYIVERTFCDKAYCSATASFDIAYTFMKYESSLETSCILHIHFRKDKQYELLAVPYDEISSHPHEKEIIFPRYSKFKVIEDEDLLKKIADKAEYELGNFAYEDLFSEKEGIYIKFPFRVFRKKDINNYIYIIPVEMEEI